VNANIFMIWGPPSATASLCEAFCNLSAIIWLRLLGLLSLALPHLATSPKREEFRHMGLYLNFSRLGY
jgi:hypothetical protein